MLFINKSTYCRYQANHFVPVVEKVWEDVRATNIAKSKNEPVTALLKLALNICPFQRLIIKFKVSIVISIVDSIVIRVILDFDLHQEFQAILQY